MIVSKKNGKIDAALFLQHLKEMEDGDYYVQLKHLNSPTKKMLGYFMGHIAVLYKGYLESAGIFVDKNKAAEWLKEAMGFGEPIIDFEMDFGLTEREWQDLIEKSFHKLIELGMNPVHPKDR
jgi:hypothetical protein